MAGVSNYIVVASGTVNIESDQGYAQDGITQSGAQQGQILPSPFFNKFILQASSTFAPLNAALAAKGYNLSDNNPSGNQSVYAQIVTQADLIPKLVTLPYAASMLFDGNVATTWQVTLYGDVTSMTLQNLKQGETYRFVFVQDSAGGHNVMWSFPAGQPIDGRAGYASTSSFQYSATTMRATAPQMVHNS